MSQSYSETITKSMLPFQNPYELHISAPSEDICMTSFPAWEKPLYLENSTR